MTLLVPERKLLVARTAEIREAIREARTIEEARHWRIIGEQLNLEDQGYLTWLRHLYPEHFSSEFASHQHEFWEWVWAVELGLVPIPPAYVVIWNRGSGKSTGLEAAVVTLGARQRRRYLLYVCDTQDRADDHVTSIGGMLESSRLATLYPAFSRRKLSKYGPQRGWRRNRLWTASGFTIDALGLDKAVRGVKLEDVRPDGVVLDDIDGALDSEGTIRKNVTIITRNLLPAMGPGGLVIGGQNLVHSTGVFARIAGMVPEEAGFSSFLVGAKVSGPIPAVEGLIIQRVPDPDKPGRTRATIIAGTPTWEAGKSIETLQHELDTEGETAFRAENQHEVDRLEGAMFEKALETVRRHVCTNGIDELRDIVSRMVRTTVWCDPAVTDKASSDAYGVQADGIDAEGTIWRFHSWENRGGPRGTLKVAIRWAIELGSPHVGVETDQGGDTWYDTFDRALEEYLQENPYLTACMACGKLPEVHDNEACRYQQRPLPTMLQDKAGAGHGPKQERGARMLVDYQRPGPPIVHVYGYPDDSAALDAALGRVFLRQPFDLADAAYWSWRFLRVVGDASTGAEASRSVGRIQRG